MLTQNILHVTLFLINTYLKYTQKLVNSHVMDVLCHQGNKGLLHHQVKTLLYFDAMLTANNEISVYVEFLNDFTSEGNRYSVKLPLKEMRPLLFDNLLFFGKIVK